VAGGAGLIRRWALTAAGLLLAAALLAPYAVMLLTALKPAAELRVSPPRLLPEEWRPQNFWMVLRDPEFQSWLTVSVVVAVVSTLLVLVAAVPAV
jgi:multiple sugar transport system permease protein